LPGWTIIIPTITDAEAPIVVSGGPVLAREGIALVFDSARSGMAVRAQASTALEAIAMIDAASPPFVGLLLVNLEFDLSDIRTFTGDERCAGVVVAAPFRSKDQVMGALAAGAQSCVSYEAGVSRLIEALKRARDGTGYLCPIVSGLMVRETEARSEMPARALTSRERDVLALIVQGLTDRQTAADLGLSVRTVHTHRQNIMAKLGVRTATALVRRAFQLKLVPD
jgi:DNA-binding NarL/FixJ family response regulator